MHWFWSKMQCIYWCYVFIFFERSKKFDWSFHNIQIFNWKDNAIMINFDPIRIFISNLHINFQKKHQNQIIWVFWLFKKHIKSYQNYFLWFFSYLINNEIHSNYWRTKIKTILKKMKKSNYFISKSYRIITLLNCLKKVSEKIVVKKLLCLKQISNMFDFD